MHNRLLEPTSIHWHDLELDSYYDGVPGIGVTSRRVTPVVESGNTFAVRLTPPRAGTFIYHTHWGHDTQLTSGLYGPMVIVEPGSRFDPESEKIFVVGTAEVPWTTSEIRLNGAKAPPPLELVRGQRYRLRLINIAPNQDVTITLGRAEDAP